LGSQLLSIHIKTLRNFLLDDLKIFKDYCPRNLFSASNFSPEKSLQKNLSIFCLENQSCDRRKIKHQSNPPFFQCLTSFAPPFEFEAG